MSAELPLRILGAALALVAAGIHLALSFADLIPGEATRGPAFALMGLGFLGCAAALFARKLELDVLVALYAATLILVYATTRGEMPIEAIGLTSKAAETALVVVTVVLLRRR